MIEDIAMILMVVAISLKFAICLFHKADLLQDFMKREYGGTLDDTEQIEKQINREIKENENETH